MAPVIGVVCVVCVVCVRGVVGVLGVKGVVGVIGVRGVVGGTCMMMEVVDINNLSCSLLHVGNNINSCISFLCV